MRPDAIPTVRLATTFYVAIAFLSLVYAFLFGHVDRLLGERVATGEGLARGLLTGVVVVAICHLGLLFRFGREAARVLGEFLGPLGVAESVYLALLSGFAEELCFRGALWPHLGLYGSSILFGVLHTVPLRALAGYPIFAALAGLVFGTLREQTGSIWPPAVAHATINALNLAWLGARERRRLAGLPPAPRPSGPDAEPANPPPLRMPERIEVEESYPITIWRYDLRVELRGTDRETLQDCLDHEDLVLFECVEREEVYRQFAEGRFVFAQSFPAPFPAFASDLSTLSTYLSQTVTGIEVAERYTDRDTTDDVRAWKIVAQRGEWVKVPLLVEPLGGGKFKVDQDMDDQEVLAAHWHEYPRWFRDGMMFKYPRLRDL